MAEIARFFAWAAVAVFAFALLFIAGAGFLWVFGRWSAKVMGWL